MRRNIRLLGMPKLTNSVLSSLKALLSAGPERESVVFDALQQLGDAPHSFDSIAEAVATATEDQDLGALVASLIRLAAGTSSRSKALEELKQSVTSSAQFSSEECERLESFFTTLFGLELIDRVASFSLAGEFERLYSGAAVLTDVRPIVSAEEGSGVTSFVLTHQLKIRYEHIDGPGELYVAATSKELKNLVEELQAALRRESNILRSLQDSLGNRIPTEED